jgi:hypothetical protein
MWTFEVLPLRVDIVPRWHLCSNKLHSFLKDFVAHFFGLGSSRYSWCGFTQIYFSISQVGNRLLQDTLIIACMIVCLLLELPRILFRAWCLNWIFNHMPFIVKLILNIFAIHHRKIILIWTSCLRQLVFIYISVVILLDHLHLEICLLLPFFLSKIFFWLLLSYLPSWGSFCLTSSHLLIPIKYVLL